MTDPYTGNRYAFTGGNPSSRIELDGHFSFSDVIDLAKSLLTGGAKAATKAPTAPRIAFEVFKNVIGWNTSTAANGFESEPGDKPDYSKGVLTEPGKEKEWQPGAARFPFSEDDCGDGNSKIYYMPLDDKGRSQGAIACLNRDDINNVDKETGEIIGGDGIFGTPTVWPTDNPLFIPKSMQKGGPLYRKGLHRGHLIANRFGGSGQDIRNLAPMYSDVNTSAMAAVENDVAAEIKGNHTVYYQVMVHYPNDSDPMPDRFDITWSSSSGRRDTVPIYNTP